MIQQTMIPSITAGVLCLLMTGCNNSADTALDQPPLRPVRTWTVASPNQADWVEFPGTVDAGQKAELGFRIRGKLSNVLVNEGDIVEQGQLLAQLDSTDHNILLKSREAEYNQVHADFLRGQALVDKGAISRSDYNKLEAQEASAIANLEAAKQNLEYTFLRAPFGGRIAKRMVDNFEEVSAMQTVFVLQDLSTVLIKVGVPESVMIRLRENAEPKVFAIFDAIPDRQFPLVRKEVSTQADKDTNTFEVTLSMPGVENYNILPGMTVTVRGQRQASQATSSFGIFIPAHAVLEDSEGRYVYIVKPGDSGRGIVERRAVETGKLSSMGLEIVSGLNTGDQIITAGMSKMHPGLEVRLNPESAG